MPQALWAGELSALGGHVPRPELCAAPCNLWKYQDLSREGCSVQEGVMVSFEQANSVLGVNFEECCIFLEEFMGQKPVWDL